MKTLEEVKNEVARKTSKGWAEQEIKSALNAVWEQGGGTLEVPTLYFSDWQEMAQVMTDKFCLVKMELVALYHAEYLCMEQRIICAEHARLEPNGMLLQVDKESILDAPLASSITT